VPFDFMRLQVRSIVGIGFNDAIIKICRCDAVTL
jgi:hypothetical protein